VSYTTNEFHNDSIIVLGGDNREVLADAPDNHFDSIVTDPPYALVSIQKRFGKEGAAPSKGNDAYSRASAGFMGKQWDTGETAFATEFWQQCFRVLKPGGHVLSFGGTRTYHRLACAIEDAGFEIRDMTAWLYGTGFPKSHNITKQVEGNYECQYSSHVNVAEQKLRRFRVELPEGKIGFAVVSAATLQEVGQEKKTVIGVEVDSSDPMDISLYESVTHIDLSTILSLNKRLDAVSKLTNNVITSTELKTITNLPIWNLLPFQSTLKSTVTVNHTALKPALEPICLARKPLSEKTVAANVLKWGTGAINIDGCRVEGRDSDQTQGSYSGSGVQITGSPAAGKSYPKTLGRHPANVIHDGSEEVVGAFPISSTTGKRSDKSKEAVVAGTNWLPNNHKSVEHTDSGSAARFFYSAKANKTDRAGSKHPTVKPVSLMRYLCRLITPPGGLILDPFAGTGTTGEAAFAEGFNVVLIEREEEYLSDICRRFSDKPTNDNDEELCLEQAA
jgi:DNA modification methylase